MMDGREWRNTVAYALNKMPMPAVTFHFLADAVEEYDEEVRNLAETMRLIDEAITNGD
jgi:hypothetical protein